MADQPFDALAHMETTARSLGLDIAPEHRLGVERFLAISASMAVLVMDFELPDELDPAPVFQPAPEPLGE